MMNNIWIALTTITLAIMAHELAHCLVAKKNGIERGFLQIGFGKKIFETEQIKLCLFPIGMAVALDLELSSDNPEIIKKTIGVIKAGYVANLAIAAVFFVLSSATSSDWIEMFYLMNLVIGLQNAVRCKFFGVNTDGFYIKSLQNKLKAL